MFSVEGSGEVWALGCPAFCWLRVLGWGIGVVVLVKALRV